MEPSSDPRSPLFSTALVYVEATHIEAIPSDIIFLIFNKLENIDFQNMGVVCKRWLSERRLIAPRLSCANQQKLIGLAHEFFESATAKLELTFDKALDCESIDPKNSDHLDLFALNRIKDKLAKLAHNVKVSVEDSSANLTTYQELRSLEQKLVERFKVILSSLVEERKESFRAYLAEHKYLLWYYKWPESASPAASTFENVEKGLSWIEFRVKQFSKALFAKGKHSEGAKLIDSQTLSPQKRATLKLPLIDVYAANPKRLKELLGDSLTLVEVQNAICEQAKKAISAQKFKEAAELLRLIAPVAPKTIEELNTICLKLIKENEIQYAMEIALAITNPKLAKFSSILEHVAENDQLFARLFGDICSQKSIEIGLLNFEIFQKALIAKGFHEKLLTITKRYATILTTLKLAVLYQGMGQDEHFGKIIASLPEGPFKEFYRNPKDSI